MTIVTIKWGQRYPACYVNLLLDASRRLGLEGSEFICFTDNAEGLAPGIQARPLPHIELPERYRWTFWRKLSLFDPALGLDGPCLYLDLDVVLTNDLRPLLADWSGRPRFIRNWLGTKTTRKPHFERINSSVMLYDGAACNLVLERFYAEPEAALARYSTDQGFIYESLADQAEFFPEGLCVSFKKHCLPRFPLNLILPAQVPSAACVVCFHGKPDPHEAAAGHSKGRLKHRCRPVHWINDIWR